MSGYPILLMHPNKPVIFHILYILIPTVSMIGNGLIVYVTVRSRALRRPCNILIAAVSLSDMMLVSSSLASTAFHNIVRSDFIPLSTCVYLQLASLFATCSSPVLLLSLAIDRLLSSMTFYHSMSTYHSRLCTAIQILPGCVLGITMNAVVLIFRLQDEDVVCLLATPMKGRIMEVYTKVAIVVCISILACYGCLMLFLKKIRMSSEKVKSLLRSVIIISLSFVFGYFSTIIILFADTVLHLNIDSVSLNQTAGIFVALATSANFFIYYGISSEYRKIFDEFLGIGRLKTVLFSWGDDSSVLRAAAPASKMVSSRNALCNVA